MTEHGIEFKALTDIQIQSEQAYGQYAIHFMRPGRQGETNIIDRINQYGQLCRYDKKLNLTGSLDPKTGEIKTFFRPGYAKVNGKLLPVGSVDWPKKLAPYRPGYNYFRTYVQYL